MVEIIAHRGASRDCLENSLDAFATALSQGADAIELDVHASADGVIVVHHDPVLVDGGAGATLDIATTAFDRIRAIRLTNGEPLPRLDDVLELVGQRARVYVEAKGTGMAKALTACLVRHPEARVAVHSFDHRIPVEVRSLRPQIPTGFLSTSYPVDLKGFLGSAPPESLWQHTSMIDRALVQNARTLGVRVIAWTENDAARASMLIALGVHGICTDTPGLLRRQLELAPATEAP